MLLGLVLVLLLRRVVQLLELLVRLNFVGVDVTAISAGVVTVSTATTSITDGNSKLFVNNESSDLMVMVHLKYS